MPANIEKALTTAQSTGQLRRKLTHIRQEVETAMGLLDKIDRTLKTITSHSTAPTSIEPSPREPAARKRKFVNKVDNCITSLVDVKLEIKDTEAYISYRNAFQMRRPFAYIDLRTKGYHRVQLRIPFNQITDSDDPQRLCRLAIPFPPFYKNGTLMEYTTVEFNSMGGVEYLERLLKRAYRYNLE